MSAAPLCVRGCARKDQPTHLLRMTARETMSRQATTYITPASYDVYRADTALVPCSRAACTVFACAHRLRTGRGARAKMFCWLGSSRRRGRERHEAHEDRRGSHSRSSTPCRRPCAICTLVRCVCRGRFWAAGDAPQGAVVKMPFRFFFRTGGFFLAARRTVTGSGERKPSGGRHSTPSRAHNSQDGRAGLGLSNDTSHVAVRAQGEAVEGKQDQQSRRGKSRSPVALVPVFLQFYGEPERKIQRDTHGKNQLKATS